MKKRTILNCSRNSKRFKAIYFFLRYLKVEAFQKTVSFLRSFLFFNCQLAMFIIVASVVHFVFRGFETFLEKFF